MKVSLKSTYRKGFRFAGRVVAPGASFEASPQDARLLKAIGRAVDSPVPAVTDPTKAPVPPPAETPPPEVETDSSDAPKAKRAYRRRDLQAEH